MNGVSLFSSAGIAEKYFENHNINIVVANELIKKRADLYSFFYPKTKMINGDISDKSIFNKVNCEAKKNDCKFLIATPPCQGMSSLGKKNYSSDRRNYLIFYVLDIIDDNDFDYILIENVTKFLKLKFPYKNTFMLLEDILIDRYSQRYNIETGVLNAKDYGVPQSRPRSIIKIWKKELLWCMPKKKKNITLRQAIGDLPSLEASETSSIKWHNARFHNNREVTAMRHTPEGQSALKNKVYYPKKKDGTPIKGFHNTYKRMKWDEPCPARAINNGNIGGHNNVHPGRKLADGTYSDARALTLRELFIVSSLPADMDLPDWCSETLIRTTIGEAIPPKFCESIIECIGKDND